MPQMIVSEKWRTSPPLKNLPRNCMSGVGKHLYQMMLYKDLSEIAALGTFIWKYWGNKHLELKWPHNQVIRNENKPHCILH